MIAVKSKFSSNETEMSKEDALIWAKRKFISMTCGNEKTMLQQINKFLVGIQFSIKDLRSTSRQKHIKNSTKTGEIKTNRRAK